MNNRGLGMTGFALVLALGGCDTPPEIEEVQDEVETVETDPEPQQTKQPPRQLTLRDRLLAGEALTTAQLERLSRGEDRFAAWSYAERLRETDPENTRVAQAENYLKAARLGSAGAPDRLAEILQTSATPAESLPAEAMVDAIEKAALRGDDELGTTLVEMWLRGSPIATDQERAKDLATARSAQTDPESAFAYARLFLASGAPVEGTVAELLTRATEAENLTTKVTAEQLLGTATTSDEPEVSEDETSEGVASEPFADDDVETVKADIPEV